MTGSAPAGGRGGGQRTGRRWTADEALHAYARVIPWLDTSSAVRAFTGGTWDQVCGNRSPAEHRRFLREQFLPGTRAVFEEAELVYADPPMVELAVAAADTLPEQPLRPDDLLAPTGFVALAVPLPDLDCVDVDGNRATARPRVITWCCVQAGVHVITWCDRFGTHTRAGAPVTYPGLCPDSLTTYPWQPGWPVPAHWTHVNVVRALTALSRQPATSTDTPTPAPKAARAAARARRGHEPNLRRVYLRRPHLASHELQAARDARAGTPARGHYVRGHWKHQWHPSVDEHRLTWIEGYLRGDFTTGTVPGAKVLVAHPHDDDDPVTLQSATQQQHRATA